MLGNFPGGNGGMIDLFLVANKAGDDPQRQDGTMRLMNPRTMNPQNVNAEDMLFSGSMINPTQMGQTSAPGRLDPGTLVYGMKIPGQNQVIVLGQAQTQKKSGAGTGGGGGSDLLSGYNDLFTDKLPINTPPDIQESTDADGVKIRKIKEKGEQHSFSLLDGLPSHGASFPMAGYRQPELPNVPTARQQNTQMLNQEMMDQMMGQIMSMAGMFQGLMGNRGGGGGGGGMGAGLGNLGGNAVYTPAENSPMSGILAGLTPAMQTAVMNLSLLVQGLEANNGVAFFTGNVVHEDTYLNNAQELLSQVQSLDDLMYVLQRLQWDTTLFGQDKLDKVVTQIETAWGTALQEVNYEGDIYVTYTNPNATGAITYAQTDILISNTGTVTGYSKVFESNNRTEWVGTLTNLEKTLGLANGDIITAEANTGSLGTDTYFAMGGAHRVEYVVNDTTIQFRTIGGSVPVEGNVANLTLHALVPEEPIGELAQIIFYDTMNSPDSSPGIGSLPSGGGSGGGGKGGLQNMFGKAAGTLQDMWKRLPTQGEQSAKQLHQKLNQNKFPQTAAEAAKKTKQGENPLDLFKKMGI